MSYADTLTCHACGFEGRRGRDVAMKTVYYDDPIPVEVAIPIEDSVHGPVGFEYRRVLGRYGAEQRCRDTTACAARVTAEAKADEVASFFAGSADG